IVARKRRRIAGKIGLWFSLFWIGLLVIIALTAQWLPLKNYGLAVGDLNQPPHWGREFFGTDIAGRSMLSRVLFGARTSLLISGVATAASAAAGSVLGLFSAYFGSWIETIGEVISNTILSVPGLLLLLVITLSVGTSIPVIIFACGLIFIPQFLRLSRANGARELTRDYIFAARGLGASRYRIIFKELVPNTWQALISYAALVMPAIMVLEGSLSFLGYGVQPPTPSWGNMIAIGLQQFNTSPWPVLIPCIFLGLSVFSLVTIGDYLRARLATRPGE
ncbi:MAG: ABC transporter permease, partial [Thermoplasmata archaeon]|nr:ABC transporter permease [Thermoplasmata archaeon]